jgi:NAD(P)-dependent dehydrogenase (short-subunit alcohol dehydrogenase family)
MTQQFAGKSALITGGGSGIGRAGTGRAGTIGADPCRAVI